MKLKNLFLTLILFTAFGTSVISAQATTTSSTTTQKPKRTYTKKSSVANDASTQSATTSTTTQTTKPKRTYTKRTTDNSTVGNTDATTTTPKRTYTRKSTTPAATTTNTAPTTQTATKPAPAQTNTQPAAKKTSSGSVFSKVFGNNSSNKTSSAPKKQSVSSGETYNGHQVMVGPRGGKYYINKNGNKTYIK